MPEQVRNIQSRVWAIRGTRRSIRRSVTAGAGVFASGAAYVIEWGLVDAAGVYGRAHTVSQIVARLRCDASKAGVAPALQAPMHGARSRPTRVQV
jgi:hypothetical protein